MTIDTTAHPAHPAHPASIDSPAPADAADTSMRTGHDLALRFVALTGLGSALAGFAGMSVAETDSLNIDPDTPQSTLIEVLGRHTGELRTGATLCVFAAVLALVFLGAVWARLKPYGEWQAVIAV